MKTKNSVLLGVVFLVPFLVFLILYSIVPFVHLIQTSVQNIDDVKSVFSIHSSIQSMIDTLLIFVVNLIVTVPLSAFFAKSVYKAKKWVLYTISILLNIISFSIVMQLISARLFFSNGLVNSQLSLNGLETVIFSRSNIFLYLYDLLPSILFGIGPLFILFLVTYRNQKSVKHAFHLSVTLQTILTLCSGLFYGSPYFTLLFRHKLYSVTYYLYLTEQFYIYILLSFILTLLLILIGNILIDLKFKFVKKPLSLKKYAVLGSISLGVYIVIFIYPFIQMIMDSLKPYNEMYIYPQTFLPKHMTFDLIESSFNLLKESMNQSILIWFYAFILLLVVNGLAGMGFSFLKKPWAEIIIFIPLVLSPFLFYLFEPENPSLITTAMTLSFSTIMFGLGTYLSFKMVQAPMQNFSSLKAWFKSKSFRYELRGLIALNLLLSVFVWIYDYYFINLYGLDRFSIMPPFGMPYSISLYFLFMLLPIVVMIITLPVVINHYLEKK